MMPARIWASPPNANASGTTAGRASPGSSPALMEFRTTVVSPKATSPSGAGFAGLTDASVMTLYLQGKVCRRARDGLTIWCKVPAGSTSDQEQQTPPDQRPGDPRVGYPAEPAADHCLASFQARPRSQSGCSVGRAARRLTHGYECCYPGGTTRSSPNWARTGNEGAPMAHPSPPTAPIPMGGCAFVCWHSVRRSLQASQPVAMDPRPFPDPWVRGHCRPGLQRAIDSDCPTGCANRPSRAFPVPHGAKLCSTLRRLRLR